MSTERLIFNQTISHQHDLTDMRHLDALIELYPWFDMLFVMKLKVLDGKKAEKYLHSNALTLFSNNYYNLLYGKSYTDFATFESSVKKKQFYNFAKTSSGESDSLIDSFLQIDLSKRKIEYVENKYVNIDLSGNPEDDIVSEEIASVYVKLGDYQEAEKIYCKLSLKYPEKSAYFAEVLQKMKNNKL